MAAAETATQPRVDAWEKVIGQATYTEDIPLPYGTAYGAILRSPYSHARIRNINAEEAERLPGVLAVLTREHLVDMDPYRHRPGFGGDVPVNEAFIAINEVRYDGEPVAAVAAEDMAIAQEAIGLIEVEYEDLPALFDPRDAIAPEAPLVHESHGSNVVGEYRWGWGNVEQGFQESDSIFEGTYLFPSVFHNPMENIGGCIANFHGNEVELVAPIQHPFNARDEIAQFFGLERRQVRIRMPYIGGGFGAKELKSGHLIALWLSRKTGRPIVTIPAAEESFRNDARHQMVYKVKTGLKADGTLWAQEIDLLVNEGAYSHGLGVTRLAVAGAWGPYKIPHIRMVGRSIYTNTVPAGSFRGLGKAQVTWGYESNLDHIARQLGIEPMEFRIKNFMRRGHVVVEGTTPLDTDYDDLLHRAAEAIQWDGKSNRLGPIITTPEVITKPLRGRGLSTTFRHGYLGGSNAHVTVMLDDRGRVKILHSAAEIGMGVYSVMARVAAESLGIPERRIDVSHPDTENPPSDGIGSSRDTVCMGNAVQAACEDLRRELLKVASICKGGDAEEWSLVGGRLWHGEQDYDIGEILAATRSISGVIMGTGAHISPRRDNPFMGTVPHWEVSAAAAEVEIDPETGQVRLLKYATVCDVGKAIHPVACKGQLDGGAVMGLGHAMYEEMVYENGQFANGEALQYRLPGMEDLPEHLTSVMVENGDGPGPQGSKGMGQASVSPVAPAIGNAIFDAIGVRIQDLPITPEKILRSLGKL